MSANIEKRKTTKKKRETKTEIKKQVANDMVKKLKGVKALTKEQLLLFYSGLITGEIKDRFGLEAPTEAKLKAADKLSVMLENDSASNTSVNVNVSIEDYSSKELQQLDNELKEDEEL